MDRIRLWLLVFPVVVGGVLVGHALAYRLTATPTEQLHSYLVHGPQVVLVLSVLGIALAGLGTRHRAPRARIFPVLALVTFVVQEHVERLVHGGLPFLLGSPAFLVGLVLQIPVALLAWALARWLLRAVQEPVRKPAVRARLELALAPERSAALAALPVPAALGRGPPPRLLSM